MTGQCPQACGHAGPCNDWRRAGVYALIDAERARQHAMWDRPHRHGWGDCSSPDVPTAVKVAVLGEEFGEAARAFLDGDEAAFREELVQLAACAIATLECPVLIDTNPTTPGPRDVPLFSMESAS